MNNTINQHVIHTTDLQKYGNSIDVFAAPCNENRRITTQTTRLTLPPKSVEEAFDSMLQSKYGISLDDFLKTTIKELMPEKVL